MTTVKISITIDKDLLKEFDKIRDETGVSISRQIELKIKGYKIVKEQGHDNG